VLLLPMERLECAVHGANPKNKKDVEV
jgi:hypothetical protein